MADLPVENNGDMNSTTAVTLLAAPAAGATQRVIPKSGASVYNADTVDIDVIFQKNKGGTVKVIAKVVGVVPGGVALLPKPVVLDATNESLEGKLGAVITTTQPTFDVAAMETT